MALMTHQIQGSYAAFPSKPVSCRRRMEPKRLLLRSTSLKRKSWLCDREIAEIRIFDGDQDSDLFSVGAPLIQRSKGKSLIIVSFKGKNGESGGRESGSESAKNDADSSCVPHDSEEDLASSSKKQNGQLFSLSEADKKLPGSLAIQKLFRSWLTLLHTTSPDLLVDGSLEGPPLLKVSSETPNVTLIKERGGDILKMIWSQFLGLDVTKRLSIVTTFTCCVAVTIKCGPKATMDLAPCWIVVAQLFALLFAIYIPIFKLVFKLYAFTFRKIAAFIKPRTMAAYDFIVSGKLKEKIRLKSWQPIFEITSEIMKWSLDHKYVKARIDPWFAGKKAEWDEKVRDYKEEIWPLYSRALRILKKTKLI